MNNLLQSDNKQKELLVASEAIKVESRQNSLGNRYPAVVVMIWVEGWKMIGTWSLYIQSRVAHTRERRTKNMILLRAASRLDH